ncbi:MAG: hypothetical protein WCX71_04285, partial [Candidatus Buchananbacteria bacterium]
MIKPDLSNESFSPNEQPKNDRLSREQITAKLEVNESLEGLNLIGLDLAGLKLEGKNFSGCDARGLLLYAETEQAGKINEITTDISNSNWTDATFADLGNGACFFKVKAAGAAFGYSEGLIARRQRLALNHEKIKPQDTG